METKQIKLVLSMKTGYKTIIPVLFTENPVCSYKQTGCQPRKTTFESKLIFSNKERQLQHIPNFCSQIGWNFGGPIFFLTNQLAYRHVVLFSDISQLPIGYEKWQHDLTFCCQQLHWDWFKKMFIWNFSKSTFPVFQPCRLQWRYAIFWILAPIWGEILGGAYFSQLGKFVTDIWIFFQIIPNYRSEMKNDNTVVLLSITLLSLSLEKCLFEISYSQRRQLHPVPKQKILKKIANTINL